MGPLSYGGSRESLQVQFRLFEMVMPHRLSKGGAENFKVRSATRFRMEKL